MKHFDKADFSAAESQTSMITDTPRIGSALENTENPLPNVAWSVLDLLILLALKRRFILVTTFSVAATTAIVSMLLPMRYTAGSSVLPPQQSANAGALLSQMAGSGGLAALAGSSLGIKNQNDMYVSMFESRTVEDAMIRRFDLMKGYRVKKMSEARKVFEKRSTVAGGLKDGIIRVTVDGPTPEQAAAMTNAYVEEFQKLASSVATTEAGQRRLFFDRQLEEAKNNLSNAEQDLKKSELTTGMIQPDSQSRALMESAAAIQGQISAKEVQIQGMSSFATDNNAEMVIAKQQLAELLDQLRKLTGKAGSESDLFVPKGKLPEAALDYVRKFREVRYRETIFQAIATQFQLARLDEAKQGAVFQIIDVAVPPDKRSFPKRTILVVVFTMLAFFSACIAVWVAAAFRRLSFDSEDGPKIAALSAALGRKQS